MDTEIDQVKASAAPVRTWTIIYIFYQHPRCLIIGDFYEEKRILAFLLPTTLCKEVYTRVQFWKHPKLKICIRNGYNVHQAPHQISHEDIVEKPGSSYDDMAEARSRGGLHFQSVILQAN